MSKHREGETPRQKPAWDAQAREKAAWLGVSEAKVTQRVEKELIRLVAAEIAQKEIARLRAQPAEDAAYGTVTETALEGEVRKIRVVFPND